MLDPDVVSLAERLITPAVADHDQALQQEVRRIQQQMAARGISGSGMNISAVEAACLREVAARAQLIFNHLFRALHATDFSASGGLATDLKQQFRRLLRQNQQVLQDQLSTIAQRVGRVAHVDKIEEEIRHQESKFEAEIDLAISTFMRSAEENVQVPIFHFHGTVGAVLTGSNTHAEVHQTITHADRVALTTALERVKADVGVNDNLPQHMQVDLADLISDVQVETAKEKPNLLRLKAGAIAVATSIQTVGALQPAYTALKAALLPFGITLP